MDADNVMAGGRDAGEVQAHIPPAPKRKITNLLSIENSSCPAVSWIKRSYSCKQGRPEPTGSEREGGAIE